MTIEQLKQELVKRYNELLKDHATILEGYVNYDTERLSFGHGMIVGDVMGKLNEVKAILDIIESSSESFYRKG